MDDWPAFSPAFDPMFAVSRSADTGGDEHNRCRCGAGPRVLLTNCQPFTRDHCAQAYSPRTRKS